MRNSQTLKESSGGVYIFLGNRWPFIGKLQTVPYVLYSGKCKDGCGGFHFGGCNFQEDIWEYKFLMVDGGRFTRKREKLTPGKRRRVI